MHLLSSALLAGGSVIDLDGTILVQLAIFLLTFFVLRSLVFKPMMELFDAREAATEGARAEAKKMDKEAREKADAFEDEMRKVRLAAGEERDRLRQEGVRLERAILERVRNETQKKLEDATTRLATEGTRLRGEIQTSVPALARQIASKMLDREVQ